MAEKNVASQSPRWIRWIERTGHKIPDPVTIFAFLFVVFILLSGFLGGVQFRAPGAGGTEVTYHVKNMLAAEQVRWLFDNAVLNNWLGFGHGVVGMILVVILCVGIAERSGLLSILIRTAASGIPVGALPLLLVFLGIMSSVAGDTGYLVLIPLAGLLYAGMGKNPLIGMAAAFAGVAAGFSANLIPATPLDVIMGVNAKEFAEAQGINFADRNGAPLNAATMNYFFMVVSTFVLSIVGAIVTKRYVAPKLEKIAFVIPEHIELKALSSTPAERRGLVFAAGGMGAVLVALILLMVGPLAAYTNAAGAHVNPFMDNIVLVVAIIFASAGILFGIGSGIFTRSQDVIDAMVKQMNTMGYVVVLTFFAYNSLSVFTYSGLGNYITYLGIGLLKAVSAGEHPLVLIVLFIILVSIINLLVAGDVSKWLLLGPIVVPMMYRLNPQMTPDVVTAAWRVADSSTNVITPMLIYAGIILAWMREYVPDFGLGDMIALMVPYSISFLVVWTSLLIIFFTMNIPFGF